MGRGRVWWSRYVQSYGGHLPPFQRATLAGRWKAAMMTRCAEVTDAAKAELPRMSPCSPPATRDYFRPPLHPPAVWRLQDMRRHWLRVEWPRTPSRPGLRAEARTARHAGCICVRTSSANGSWRRCCKLWRPRPYIPRLTRNTLRRPCWRRLGPWPCRCAACASSISTPPRTVAAWPRSCAPWCRSCPIWAWTRAGTCCPPMTTFLRSPSSYTTGCRGTRARSSPSTSTPTPSYLERLAAQMGDLDADVWVIHDPQPLPLRALVPLRGAAIWRCHIDCSTPNGGVHEYLQPWIQAYDRALFSMPEYVLPGLQPEHVRIVHPAIDPVAPKNRPLPPSEATAVLANLGIDSDRPLVTQVSRFDPWKNPWQVVDAYRQ